MVNVRKYISGHNYTLLRIRKLARDISNNALTQILNKQKHDAKNVFLKGEFGLDPQFTLYQPVS